MSVTMVRVLTTIMAAAMPWIECTSTRYATSVLRVNAKRAIVETHNPIQIHLFLPILSARIPITGPQTVSVTGYAAAIIPTIKLENSLLGRYNGSVNSTSPKLKRIKKIET
jgi:hypothetical protein